MFDPTKPLLTLSDTAAEHVRALVEKAPVKSGEGGVIGIRVSIKTAGCSGMKYEVEYAYDKKPFEDAITQKGVTVLVDPAAVMFIVGSEMDWSDDKFASGFTFTNPNETARCGCGESFSVA